MRNHSNEQETLGQDSATHAPSAPDIGAQTKPAISGFLAAEIIDAAGLGQLQPLKWFLERQLLDVDLCGIALCAAAHHGQIHVVNLLLKHGGDVRLYGEAPLFWAAVGGHLAIISVLQRRGATTGVGTVCWAALHGKPRCLALLMPSASWRRDELREILWHASSASENRVECARIVIRHCSNDYLAERIAKWDKSVCADYPDLQTLKLLVRHELRHRG